MYGWTGGTRKNFSWRNCNHKEAETVVFENKTPLPSKDGCCISDKVLVMYMSREEQLIETTLWSV